MGIINLKKKRFFPFSIFIQFLAKSHSASTELVAQRKKAGVQSSMCNRMLKDLGELGTMIQDAKKLKVKWGPVFQDVL